MPAPATGATRLVGLLGWPVAHSKSPAFQNAAFAAIGLDWFYVPLPTPPAHLPEAVRGLAALGFAGANVTIPHKETICSLLDRLDPEAELSGAVNTIVVEGWPDRPRLVGHATDGPGFLASLREETGCDPRGMTVLLLGAGGAARGVAVALVRAGAARLLIANRTASRASALAQALSARLDRPTGRPVSGEAPRIEALPLEAGALAEHLPAVDLVVQATALGMAGGPDPCGMPPLDVTRLPRHAVVADLVYVPALTPLLAAAAGAGRRTVGGLGMLLHQGALAFERWTGRAAPLPAMRAALEATIAREADRAGRAGPPATGGDPDGPPGRR